MPTTTSGPTPGMRARPVRRPLVLVTAVLAVLVLGSAVWAWVGRDEEKPVPNPSSAVQVVPEQSEAAVDGPAAVTADLTAAAGRRVFFGHQSVGQNLLDGIPQAYRRSGLAVPTVVENEIPADRAAGFIDHAYIGENEKPFTKLKDFEARIRSGVGGQVDVAMMKFCWVDFTTDTDVQALFTAYRETLNRLERDYPRVTFVAVTAPLMTNPGMLNRIKNTVTGGDRGGTAENVVREQFNSLVRQEYGGKNLFDLAALESTTPDGTRVSGTQDGKVYYALYDGYASDRGHLNPVGMERIAQAWMRFIAHVGGS